MEKLARRVDDRGGCNLNDLKAKHMTIQTIEQLEAIYGRPSERSLKKVATHITPLYAQWIEAARFVVLATVGPDGTDASPRGDDGAVVTIENSKTLMMPDWRGNNRLDSLRNIVVDGRVSLMFMIHGQEIVVRVNGTAKLTNDEATLARFEKNGKQPKTVIVIAVQEVYFQCAKSIMRSRLWQDENANVPTAGQLLKEQIAEFDAEGFDQNYRKEATEILWG